MVAKRAQRGGEDQPSLAGPQTWLGAPSGLPTTQTRAAIAGIPFDCGTHPNRIGSRMGPAAIREMTTHLRRYDPRTNIDLVAALGLVDCGDVRVTASQVEEAFAAIESAIVAIAARGVVPVTMGGDGAVTLPQVRAMARHRPGLCMVHIDAHTDAYPIQGYNTATGFRHMAQEGLIDTKRSFQIGMRGPTLVPGVFEFCRELGYTLVTMAELVSAGYEAVAARVIETIGERPVYLCYDMDFFDPAVAPGVCTPTWGGCTAREGLGFVEMLRPLNTVLFDVNTVSPPHDPGSMTAFLAATLQWTFLAGLAQRQISTCDMTTATQAIGRRSP